jgi:hypothetical protein
MVSSQTSPPSRRQAEDRRIRVAHPVTVIATLNNGLSAFLNNADDRASDPLIFGDLISYPNSGKGRTAIADEVESVR